MKHHILLTGFLCSLFLVSCHTTSKSEIETTVGNYKAPETIPLQFTVPESFEWKTITNDTLTTPVSYELNVDELPTRPFELNTFKPLESPMKEFDLDWDTMPSEKLEFDSIPFTVKTSTIKKPTVTKMKSPANLEGTNANLLQLSVTEGLPVNEISDMVETEDGSIWIASSSGTGSLIRYDGENAFIYDYTNIYGMTLDRQGRLWLVTTTNGIHVLDFNNNVENVITLSTSQFLGLEIICDHTGAIYFSAWNDGIYRMDADIKNLKKLKNTSAQVFSLYEDSQNDLWIGGGNGLALLNAERTSFKKIIGNDNYNLNGFVSNIKEDKNGNIWINQAVPNTATIHLLQISLKNKKIAMLSSENGLNIRGQQVQEDNLGNMWIAGANELFILSNDKKSSKTIGINSATQGNLKRTRSLKRKDGTLWFGTVDNGVVIVNDFTLNTEYFDASRGLIDEQIWDIEEDTRGELWLGTNAGINIVDLQKNTIKSLSHQELHRTNTTTLLYVKEVSKDMYFIDSGLGFSIYDRKQNVITQYASNTDLGFDPAGFAKLDDHSFLLYTPEGLLLYDIENNSLKKLISKSDPDILKAINQSGIIYNANDILWIPTKTKGLAKVDFKNNNVSYLREKEGFVNNEGTVACITKEGEVWAASLNGISILNFEDNTLTNLKEENGLIPAETYDLIERNDIIYAATVNGLVPIKKASAKTTNKGFYNFNGGFGFKANDYLEGSAKFLKNGQFWSGVANPASQFKLLIMDSAPKPDTTLSSVYITKMYIRDEDPGFSPKSSIDTLNTRTISYAKENKMIWDSIKKPYNIPNGLVLPFDQNSLSFSYASGDLFNRDQLNYRFILDGEDKDWTDANTQTKTKNYYNLKPGEYTFKVAARSFNNEWSTPDELKFSISPPWWQTWWAYLLYTIIAASILRLYIVFRARKLTQENKYLEEKVKERTNELTASIEDLKITQEQLIQSEKMASLGELTAGIAHEIQNPLNFVNNFAEVNTELIEEMKEELDKGNIKDIRDLADDINANEKKIMFHGQRADSIVKGMLKHSRSHKGKKEPTNINALVDEYLRLAYHGLRAKDKSFNASMHTDFDDTIGAINIIGQDISRVILNLITNAFYVVDEKKKTGIKDYDPTVSVSTKKIVKATEIRITDNGNGIPKNILSKIFEPFFTTKPTGEGTGLGLSMSYEIITQGHGGELKVDTKIGEGTTFIIKLPTP
ncbi:MAG: hypothetical protein KC469_03340 [Flavobacteriaceae bacterium]|nr:hypothetical protein [Flavobacteriaceae bacterium]